MQHVTWWQAIILGLAQGLTEFIPVSSSAHLNITHWLFNQPRDQIFTYDMMLNIGTLAALMWYFRHDWKQLLTNPAQVRLRNLVILACVPAGIVGVLLRGLEEKHPLFADVRANATMLIIAGAALYAADIWSRKTRRLENINLSDSLVVGCSQALALIPGVSRSGATITAGLLKGFDRESAARFSFLMSLPITLGAVCFEIFGAIRHHEFASINASPAVVVLGVLVSGASGFWAIGFLLNYLKTRSVLLFFLWRVVVAITVFALYPFLQR
jgi:undecaprenyl-diphosphatase